MTRRNLRIGRRHAALGIGLAGAAAVVPLVPSIARARTGAEGVAAPPRTDAPEPRPSAPDVLAAHDLAPPTEAEHALLGSLATGAVFGAGTRRYRVASVFAARAGAVPLVLEEVDGDARFAVELLRRDDGDAVQPVARTASLALFVRNGGDGSRATQEAQGLAVLALARAISERETAGGVAALSTRRERAARHPMGVFHVPLAGSTR